MYTTRAFATVSGFIIRDMITRGALANIHIHCTHQTAVNADCIARDCIARSAQNWIAWHTKKSRFYVKHFTSFRRPTVIFLFVRNKQTFPTSERFFVLGTWMKKQYLSIPTITLSKWLIFLIFKNWRFEFRLIQRRRDSI